MADPPRKVQDPSTAMAAPTRAKTTNLGENRVRSHEVYLPALDDVCDPNFAVCLKNTRNELPVLYASPFDICFESLFWFVKEHF